MTELADFLLARLAEDEEIARKAEGYGGCDHRGWPLWTVSNATYYGHNSGPRGSVEATPARVLAECEAKRQILREHWSTSGIWGGKPALVCARCRYGDAVRYRAPCPTLRFLALPYADHEDHREEWRP